MSFGNGSAALPTGTRLGCYEIAAPIGAGGMGEVYRARDTNLKRDVAIKVLPAALAGDSARLARLQREAELLAALNHPNIAQIYGIERGEGLTALVLELVDGATLGELVAAGPLPLDDALAIARQIAAALAAAHERGIIHRDLKPANIKIRPDGTVKVLDFGIAKALDTHVTGGAGAAALTTPAMTEVGMVLGTSAYMSPEQARGRAVDRRADIWAFGCVLYEMLTGQPAFIGEDVSTTLARALEHGADLDALPRAVPAAVRQTIALCLQRDVDRRLHDIGDVRLALDGAFAPREPSSSGAQPARPRLLPIAAAVALTAVAAAAATLALRPEPPTPVVTRSTLVLPGDLPQGTGDPPLAFSPDGRTLALTAGGQLVLRRLDRTEVVALPGTEGAMRPVFSPDGEWLAFIVDQELRRIRIDGTNAVRISTVASTAAGLSWGTDGMIYIGTLGGGGITRVPASGGEPESITKNDIAAGEVGHRYPQVLPGARAVLFTIFRADESWPALLLLDTLEVRRLPVEGLSARYSPSGHIVVITGNTLSAVPFDLETLSTSGSPTPVIDDVVPSSTAGGPKFAISTTGTLAYVPVGVLANSTANFHIVDRRGNIEVTIPAGGLAMNGAPDLAPDGQRFAAGIDAANGIQVLLFDITGGAALRLTREGRINTQPLWTPDGAALAFNSVRAASGLYRQLIDGTQAAELLLPRGPGPQLPLAWSPSDDTLLFQESHPTTRRDLWLLSATGETTPLLVTPADEFAAQLSPDGRWLVYASDVSGQPEVYVMPFPGGGSARIVSRDGGAYPRWAGNGEIVYRRGDEVVSVAITGGERLAFGAPTALFAGAYAEQFAVTADGQRFVLFRGPESGTGAALNHVTLVTNWFAELERLVPTSR